MEQAVSDLETLGTSSAFRYKSDMPTGPELARWIRKSGAFIRTGPFTIHVRTSIERAIDGIAALYDIYPASREEAFADFHVELTRAGGLRRWIRPQVNFEFDGAQPYRPLPLEQALPMFEWGLNAVISNNAHQYLIVQPPRSRATGSRRSCPARRGRGRARCARPWSTAAGACSPTR